jgi:hypothetical protein
MDYQYFVSTDVQLTIAGFDGSTEIASLVEAFKTLSIDVTLPGLSSTNLLDTAAFLGSRIICINRLIVKFGVNGIFSWFKVKRLLGTSTSA